MHAKVTVADDTVFVGSFNLSHSGELNGENVLAFEITADSFLRHMVRTLVGTMVDGVDV